jgi:hypothetical protein
MDKRMLSQFLQHYYHPDSPHFTHMQTLAAEKPRNHAAIACYCLMAAADWVNDNQGNINRAHNYLSDQPYTIADCLWQSIGFMTHPNIDLRTRILMHKSAYYNLRGQQLYPNNYNLTLIDLSWANFAEANLHVVDLRASNLTGASFRAANLSGAFLSGSKLHHADLTAANLQHAHLEAWQHPLPEHADAMTAHAADLRSAKYNAETKFPLLFSPVQNGIEEMTSPEMRKNKACMIL